jgi:hypothetical protein
VAIIRLLGGVDNVEHATVPLALRRRRSMKKEGSHEKGIADVRDARNEGCKRNGADLFGCEDARTVATREYEEGAALAIGPVEMDANGQQTSECSWAGFGHRDTFCHAVLWTAVGSHWQDAILMDWNGPVCGGLLVKIGSVDWENVDLEKLGNERINPGRLQFGTKLRDRSQKVASAHDEPRTVPGGMHESLWFQQSQESFALRFTNRAGDSDEPFGFKISSHFGRQRNVPPLSSGRIRKPKGSGCPATPSAKLFSRVIQTPFYRRDAA